MMKLVTSRFLLRDFVETDRQSFITYQIDPRYRRLYDLGDSGADRAVELFDRFKAWRDHKPRQNYQVGIFDQASQLCGCAGLRQEGRPDGTAVFGLELTPDHWGHYAAAIEAASALIEYGFRALKLTAMTGETASGNSRVEKLARWFGASIVGQREGPAWMQARGWTEVEWALSFDAWMASRGRRHFRRRTSDDLM